MISEQKLLAFVRKTIPIINKEAISNNLFKFKSKKDFQTDPVTKFDIDMEKLIRKLIKSNFNNHNIIGEELKSENNNSDFTWIIDPIDGTKSLILNLPNWSNLICLYFKKKCIFSFANFPVLKKTYIGLGNKTLLLTKSKKYQIKSNKKVASKNMKLAINTLHSLRDKRVKNYILNFKGFFKVTGSDAYNFCSIAEGKLDALIESGLKQVDILPIVQIVKNSGAIITNWKGGDNFEEGRVLVASNNIIHKYLLKKINS
jgi:fructose-1,6-bisphosphatase/inositol monophosphatase family enzyme